MKISLLIAAVILGIAALFAVPRRNEIKLLTTEWTKLEDRARALDVPTDPKVPFSSDRIRAESARAAKAEKVNDFADELIAFFHKMKDLEKSGTDPSEFQSEIAEIIGKVIELSPDELRLLVKAISADTTIDAKSKLELIGFSTMMLASDNPEAALAIALEARETLDAKGEKDQQMIRMILMQYAAKDPIAAGQWLADHGDKIGGTDDSVKQGMIRAAAQKDLGLAIGLIDTLKLGKETRSYAILASAVTGENADNFLAAIRDSAADPEQRKQAFAGLSNSPLMKDFEVGTAWLEKSDLSGEEREGFLSNLSYYGVKDQPAKWLDWISGQEKSEGFDPSTTTENIIRGWTRQDFAATGEWINGQDDGEQKEKSIRAYAATLAPYEPAAAADWAATLSEGPERENLFKTIHSSFEKKDPQAAAAFAEKYGLKEE